MHSGSYTPTYSRMYVYPSTVGTRTHSISNPLNYHYGQRRESTQRDQYERISPAINNDISLYRAVYCGAEELILRQGNIGLPNLGNTCFL